MLGAYLHVCDGVDHPSDRQEVRILRQEAVLNDAPPMVHGLHWCTAEGLYPPQNAPCWMKGIRYEHVNSFEYSKQEPILRRQRYTKVEHAP